jgi:hypothetical protein
MQVLNIRNPKFAFINVTLSIRTANSVVMPTNQMLQFGSICDSGVTEVPSTC